MPPAKVDFTKALRSLTREIEDAVPLCTFPSVEKCSRSKLEEAVHLLPLDHHALLADEGMLKRRQTEDRKREIRVDPDPPIQHASGSHFFETSLRVHIPLIDATGSYVLCFLCRFEVVTKLSTCALSPSSSFTSLHVAV